MRQLCTVTHSRHPWQAKATPRSDHNRSLRKQLVRVKAARDQAQQGLKAPPSRLRPLERPAQAVAARPQLDVVWLGRHRFLKVRLSWRALCRVLSLLAPALGITQAPCPQTVSTWVLRLSIVRIASARGLRGVPLSQAPFSHGLLWRIDRSIGLGAGKI